MVRQRRTLADGTRFVNIVCPVCDRRHWLPAASTGHCPRRHNDFAIASQPPAPTTKTRHRANQAAVRPQPQPNPEKELT